MPSSNNTDVLRSLLGFPHYYGEFCCKFSLLARDLCFLLKKMSLGYWKNQHSNAVFSLKSKIMKGITPYDVTKPLYLICEAFLGTEECGLAGQLYFL